ENFCQNRQCRQYRSQPACGLYQNNGDNSYLVLQLSLNIHVSARPPCRVSPSVLTARNRLRRIACNRFFRNRLPWLPELPSVASSSTRALGPTFLILHANYLYCQEI